jgi:hypothetical protein
LKSPVVLDVTILQIAYTTPPNIRFKRMSFSARSFNGSMNVIRVTLFRWSGSSGSCMQEDSLVNRAISGRWIPESRREPLPAMLRRVSGRKRMIMMMTTDERMTRNMKMDRKPKKLARRPPRTGPMAILKLRTIAWIPGE